MQPLAVRMRGPLYLTRTALWAYMPLTGLLLRINLGKLQGRIAYTLVSKHKLLHMYISLSDDREAELPIG